MQAYPPLNTESLMPRYQVEGGTHSADRIDSLLARFEPDQRKFSQTGIEAFRSGQVTEHSTCFERIRRVFPLGRNPLPSENPGALKPALIKTLEDNLARSENYVVALSGGIDSFLLACLLREILGHPPKTATLISHLPGYCEGEATLRRAGQLGLDDVETIEVSEESFVARLPEVISACEVPLYNLHPVSKWLFAQGLQKRGYTGCLTGDGADQIAAGKIAFDYLPLLAPLFKDHQINLVCPFLSPPVMRAIQSRGTDPDKQMIRELAMKYLPGDFSHQKKRPCFTPPMDLSRYRTTRDSYDHLATDNDSDRELTFLTTLGLLEHSHLKQKLPCAPSPA